MKSYLTAEQLEISEDWRNALIRVMHDLETRELPGKLNMNKWHSTAACGTVACIGGWCQVYMGIKYPRSNRDWFPPVLNGLFYPHDVRMEWADITRIQAAKVIDCYLRIGNAYDAWRQVLPTTCFYPES